MTLFSLAIVPSLNGVGIFEVEMSLYETENFSTKRTGRTFNSMDKLNVKISSKADADLGLKIDTCWITAGDLGENNTDNQLILIDESCPNEQLQ